MSVFSVIRATCMCIVMRKMGSVAFYFMFFSVAAGDIVMGEACSSYTSSCGDIHLISYPFGLKGDPNNCGDPQYQLACESNRTVLHLHSQKYYVKSINYSSQMLRVLHSSLETDKFCSSLPPLLRDEFRYEDPYVLRSSRYYGSGSTIIFVNCSAPVVNNPSYIAATPCLLNSSSTSSNNNTSQAYLYALAGSPLASDLHENCNVIATVPVPDEILVDSTTITNYSEIRSTLLMGFDLSWKQPFFCRDCLKRNLTCRTYLEGSRNSPVQFLFPYDFEYCEYSSACDGSYLSPHCFFRFVSWILLDIVYYGGVYGRQLLALLIIARAFIGTLCLSAFLVYKFRRRHVWMDTTVEEFLSNYRKQTPTRYSYSQIKKMTNNFKEKLGQGGYGSVYKGKLLSGHIVAIKLLDKSKGNGQEFINEVATIGRIHHLNVVRFIGFCSDGSKRALIYDFMPNGSLDKYIFPQEGKINPLGWEKIFEIALGIARGIDYLHRGCDMQILHFDIKPHNILLDKNFVPKISDFGLAKFYPTNDSIVAVTAVRGTMGYIAPELIYRNVGGVSYKSDVYSFGMMLMEMAGRRKNLNALAENTSQIYFPLWIYDRLDEGRDLELEDTSEDEKEIAKKLIIIALWCIQMKPSDRPSMSKVVEMLEASQELLQMPPKPFVSPSNCVPEEDQAIVTDPPQLVSHSSLSMESGT